MLIRPYVESDRRYLQRIYLDARTDSWDWLDSSVWELGDFDKATKGERILVAAADGQPVGFASIFTESNFLHSLFVDPQAQRRGVGLKLLCAAQSTFTANGSLKCIAKNEGAVRFYERHGWLNISSHEGSEGTYLLMHYNLVKASF